MTNPEENPMTEHEPATHVRVRLLPLPGATLPDGAPVALVSEPVLLAVAESLLDAGADPGAITPTVIARALTAILGAATRIGDRWEAPTFTLVSPLGVTIVKVVAEQDVDEHLWCALLEPAE